MEELYGTPGLHTLFGPCVIFQSSRQKQIGRLHGFFLGRFGSGPTYLSLSPVLGKCPGMYMGLVPGEKNRLSNPTVGGGRGILEAGTRTRCLILFSAHTEDVT